MKIYKFYIFIYVSVQCPEVTYVLLNWIELFYVYLLNLKPGCPNWVKSLNISPLSSVFPINAPTVWQETLVEWPLCQNLVKLCRSYVSSLNSSACSQICKGESRFCSQHISRLKIYTVSLFFCFIKAVEEQYKQLGCNPPPPAAANKRARLKLQFFFIYYWLFNSLLHEGTNK